MRNAPLTLLVLAVGPLAAAQPATPVSRTEYADRLEAFWLAQCIANWTGRQTEGARREPPFMTDDDWGTPTNHGTLTWVLDQDPWAADDDTDIEYVYVNELAELDTRSLTPAQIRQAWIEHINDFIWVSNERARQLMDLGMQPPSTGLAGANPFYRHIDAQLTTEVFGALAPGLPHAALEIADLPIATVARTHAAHASEFHVVLHAFAPIADNSLPPAQRVEWMVQTARQYIPDSSKAADIVDTVYADFLANPDPTDWERTRDLVYDRYQLNDAANGFSYRSWTESSVNFAAGLIALIYGQGNFPETVRIGTLTGCDSDNGTATMGGLLGLMLGRDELIAQIQAVAPGQSLSDRYWITRTRDAMTDFLPADPDAEDTFPLLARRMLPVVDLVMADAGAAVGPGGWVLPAGPLPDPVSASPMARRWAASANNDVRLRGGTVAASSSAIGVDRTLSNASTSPSKFANGSEHNGSGVEPSFLDFQFYASTGADNVAPGDDVTLTVTYSLPVEAHGISFVEGPHTASGGWFVDPAFEVRIDGQWVPAPGQAEPPFDQAVPYQTITHTLDQPATVTGVRITGRAGGSAAFVTALELDALADTARPDWPGYDCPADTNLDAALTPADFNAWIIAFNSGDPACDQNDDGLCTPADFNAWILNFNAGCG